MTVVLATARGSTAASGPGFSPVVLAGLVAPVGLVDLAVPPASDGSSAHGAESSPAGLRARSRRRRVALGRGVTAGQVVEHFREIEAAAAEGGEAAEAAG